MGITAKSLFGGEDYGSQKFSKENENLDLTQALLGL